MKISKFFVIALAAALFFLSPAAHAATIETTTPSGPVMGTLTDDGLAVYKGIPYAKPPVGNLRFAPPQNVVPWTQTLDCRNFGPAALQNTVPERSPSMSEDCLTINVWTPAKPQSTDKLPVYVFIHGGAFAQGAGSEPTYDGTNFAKDGIVTVTFNYRLNTLGFFASQSTFDTYGTTGNWGILDTIKALEWIRDNIAAFGGDPNRVTIGGESAGSYITSALVISPLASGLFHGAIMESGTVLQLAGNTYYSKGDRSRSIEVMNMLAFTFRASDTPEGLAKLRSVDGNALAQLAPLEVDFTRTTAFFMLPVYDGHVLPRDPARALQEGKFNHVKLLVGYNNDEGSIFIPAGTDELTYEMVANRSFGYDKARKVLARFPVDAQNSSTQRTRQLLAYGMFSTAMKTYADALSRSGLDVYAYKFDFVTEENAADGLGARHGSELPYVFGTLDDEKKASPKHRKLSGEMHTRWANFIKTGDPNVGDAPPTDAAWPKYDPDASRMLFFDEAITSGPMPDKENMTFMEGMMFGDDPYYGPISPDEPPQPVPAPSSSSSSCHAGAVGIAALIGIGMAAAVARKKR